MEKKSTIVRLVWIAGMQVTEDKVQGRLNAVRQARERNEQYPAIEDERLAKEEKELLKKGYTKAEINCLRHANRISKMEAMGLGVRRRVRRISVPAWIRDFYSWENDLKKRPLLLSRFFLFDIHKFLC